MKVFAATLLVLVLAFTGIKMMQTPSTSTVKAVQQENMTQFSNDFANYMEVVVAKEGGISKDVMNITADCKPNQGVSHTRCWVTIRTTLASNVDKATAENVRRVGDKFVWDRES
jgi:hypothetical protein